MNALEIKEKRKIIGLTQQELAVILGVSLKTVTNYENGGVIPESKQALLRTALEVAISTIETSTGGSFSLILKQNEEKIKEVEKIIYLHQSMNDKEQIKHYQEIIRLIKIQNTIIIESKNDMKQENKEVNYK
jgi:transcriptional regulator with XRE-family HTH domain